MKNIWVLLLIIALSFQIHYIFTKLHLLSEFPKDKLEWLRKKNVYPYEWVDSCRKFIYPRLPPKEAFYSSINDGKREKGDGHISDERYSHLKNVWWEFGFKTFRDFHNH